MSNPSATATSAKSASPPIAIESRLDAQLDHRNNRRMNHPRRLFPGFFLVIFGLVGATIAQADSGIDVQVGSATVEVAAVTDNAFRLTISYDGKPHPAQSIYLAPNPIPTQWTAVTENNWTGIKSPAGELLIDPAKAQWTLRDPNGKTLIPPGPISQSTRNEQTGKPFIILSAGCPSDRPF